MKTVAHCISEIIARQPFIEEALSQKIINYSSLADQLVPNVSEMMGRDVKAGAIMMALRRYVTPTDLKKSTRPETVLKSLGDITVRSELTDFTFRNSATLFKNHAKVLEQIATERSVFYAFTRGIHESTVIVSTSAAPIIRKGFQNEMLLQEEEDLSAVSISLPEGNTKISGLYYQIFKRLAWEGIALHEVVSTTNEFTILVQDALVDRAFSVIKKLKN